MVLPERVIDKMKVNGLVRQKDSEHKEERTKKCKGGKGQESKI